MISGIKLFVGLGNIGDKYVATRHNAGFWWINQIAMQTNTQFLVDAKFFGVVGKLDLDKYLLKPSTYMNDSGKAVAALSNYYKITPAEILVVHDELDLPPGSAKLKFGGGHGGHNGLKDIHSALGTPDYWRLRLGIGHPGNRNEVINFVLKAPTPDENDALQASIYAACGVFDFMLKGEFESAMLKLHTK